MLHHSDDSSSCSDDDNDFLLRKSPRRSFGTPQHAKVDKGGSLTRSGAQGPGKYKSSSIDGDLLAPAKDGHLLTAKEGYESGTSRPTSRPHSRSPSPAPDIADFVVVSKESSRRVSGTLFDWTMVEAGRSGDELSGAEDASKDMEDFEKKKLYLLVAQCIAYPFNAKFQIENTPPRTKLNTERFGRIKRILHLALEDYSKLEQMHSTRLSKQEQDVVKKQGFLDSVQWMLDIVFPRPEIKTICEEGGFSVKELETIFGVRVASELAKESSTGEVGSADITLWCVTFRKIIEQGIRGFLGGDLTPPHSRKSGSTGNTTMPVKDQLYKLFQKVLKIPYTVHQVLYRECQLGDLEEQEAVVRRELQTRRKTLEDPRSSLNEGKFGSKRVEVIYREEQLKMLTHLNTNLDMLSLQGTGVNTVEKKKKKGDGANVQVSKRDLQFNLKIKVTLHNLVEIQQAHKNKEVFCTFGLQDTSGKEKEFMTPPCEVQSSSVSLGVENEFWVCTPLPHVNFDLRCNQKAIFGGSKLAKYTHTAYPSPQEMMTTVGLLQKDAKEGNPPVAKLKISTLMERPSSMKKCGYLYCVGDMMFKQRKRTFLSLVQLSQYKFVLCSYLPNASHPKDTLMLDQGLTVEYASDSGQFQGESDARYLFDLIFDESEMGCIHFGCRDDTERQSWIEWMVRGTGQSTQPQQLGTTEVKKCGSTELERYGLKKVVDEVASVNTLEPHLMFVRLFQATLKFRLEENMFSRGLFSPAQMYVLDEFCARYGVRDPFRHLTCLKEWLDHLERGVSIWPIMIQSSFRFCQMHVGGMNPPDKAVIVTTDERTQFVDVCKRIEEVVTYQINNFRTAFPFCCPKGDLRTTLKLFDMVATINYSARQTSTPFPQNVLNNMLERAALNNYKYVYAKLDLSEQPEGSPLTMVLTFELAKLCIDFMYELHDFYWEELYLTNAIQQHINAFWLFFLVDVKEAMAADSNVILKLQLFHIVNRYFSSQLSLKLDEFKSQFLAVFSPVVTTYIETLETSLKQELSVSLSQETWLPVTTQCCGAMEKAMKSLQSFQRFLDELSWPDKIFSMHLEHKVAGVCADCFQMTAKVIEAQYFSAVLLGRRNLSLSYTLPQHFFTLLNTLVYLVSQVKEMCPHQSVRQSDTDLADSSDSDYEELSAGEYLTNVLDGVMNSMVEKLCTPMGGLLEGLNKYDPSDGFLASLKRLLPGKVPIDGYKSYLSRNLDLVKDCIVNTIFQNFVVYWYDGQMKLLSSWLDKRPEFSLHPMQQSFVEELSKVLYETVVSYEGIPPRRLRTESYDLVQDRIRMEKSNVDLLQIGKT